MTGAAVYLILGLSLLLATVLPYLTQRIADPQGPCLGVHRRNGVVQPLRDRHLIGLKRSTLV